MENLELFESLHKQLKWPDPQDIFEPEGAGPAVYARLAERKIGQPLRQFANRDDVVVAVLSDNPNTDDFDAPVAIAIHFASVASSDVLREAHRLAWNFCRTPLLITIEPHVIRTWSCYEKPNEEIGQAVEPVTEFQYEQSQLQLIEETLHWIELASGNFVENRRERFPLSQRADQSLLDNLSFVRSKLRKELPEDVVHDLLARLIFIQFLCQRKDSYGRPALNETVFQNLHDDEILANKYSNLADILRHKGDTYALFEWLNERFNGDLFPSDWRREKAQVKATNLKLLADFVSGDLELANGQKCLWPLYSFDAIPLEFISSIYEEFVTNRSETEGIGEHYTPPHIVDFLLDKILPWSGTDYDLRVLDPACGSAVFLVKVYQRLVNRWRNAHPNEEPPASVLRKMLEENLFGVDIEPRAIRVASFSLYIAMCDEIDPRHYWQIVRFPKLREVTLRSTDFFAEDVDGISTEEDKGSFDLVLGNAPWGDSTLTELAKEWAAKHDWPTSDEQIGPLFLRKALELVDEKATVSMIQSASSLLFNRGTTSLDTRKRLFLNYKVDEVVNLSALRFRLFPNAIGPSCIVTIRNCPPDSQPIAYWSPKQSFNAGEYYRIVIDSHDLNWVGSREAAVNPNVWSALAWGGRRDLELVERLQIGNPTLKSDSRWETVRGFQRGIRIPQSILNSKHRKIWKDVSKSFSNDRVQRALLDALDELDDSLLASVVCYESQKPAISQLPSSVLDRIAFFATLDSSEQVEFPECDAIVILAPVAEYPDREGIPILENQALWSTSKPIVTASIFPRNTDVIFERPREIESFNLPAIVMRETWTVDEFRFQNVLVEPDSQNSRLLFSQSFYGIRGPSVSALRSMACALQSSLAVHYFYLSSGRLASYRPTLRKVDLVEMPIPPDVAFAGFQEITEDLNEDEIDSLTFAAYGLESVEKTLVEDFYRFTLADYKGDEKSLGRQRLTQQSSTEVLQNYCDHLKKVLLAAFGEEKCLSSTIYTSAEIESFPYCFVAIHFGDKKNKSQKATVDIDSSEMRNRIEKLSVFGEANESTDTPQTSIFYQRVSRIYVSGHEAFGCGEPTVIIIKPNANRYWTGSIAFRDGDEIAADIFQWTEIGGLH